MRIPYSWLREVVQAGAPGWDVSADELEQAFIRIGHEVEDVITAGPVTGPLVVGRVAEIDRTHRVQEAHPGLQGRRRRPEPRDIVCGATNFAVGDLVVVALPGACCPATSPSPRARPTASTSDGMICSAAELNLGADHSGIMVLPPGTAEPGAARRRRARPRRRGVRPGHHPGPRLLPVDPRHGPRDRLRLRPGLRRPGRRACRCPPTARRGR